MNLTHPVLTGSDHRPVKGKVVCEGEETTKGGWKNIAMGWRAQDEDEREKNTKKG